MIYNDHNRVKTEFVYLPEGKHCKSEVRNCVSIIFCLYVPLRTLIPPYFTHVHSYSLMLYSCSLLLTRILLVFTLIHSCSLMFIGVLLVFIGVHWCSLVFTRVHWCSLVFPFVWCFRQDLILQLSRLDKVICYSTFCDDQFTCLICNSIFVFEDSSLKPCLHISRKDRKHMVGNVYFKMY